MDIFQVGRGIRQSISQFPHYGIVMMLQNSLGDRRQNTNKDSQATTALREPATWAVSRIPLSFDPPAFAAELTSPRTPFLDYDVRKSLIIIVSPDPGHPVEIVWHATFQCGLTS
jgi:hypothetical protein